MRKGPISVLSKFGFAPLPLRTQATLALAEATAAMILKSSDTMTLLPISPSWVVLRRLDRKRLRSISSSS